MPWSLIQTNRPRKHSNDEALYLLIPRVIQKSDSPRWNKAFEFLYLGDKIDRQFNILMLSIYDSDPLGSDELICTQFIPLYYYTDDKKHLKPLDFWLQMNSVDNLDPGQKIVIDTSENIHQGLELPRYEDQILVKGPGEKTRGSPPFVEFRHFRPA